MPSRTGVLGSPRGLIFSAQHSICFSDRAGGKERSWSISNDLGCWAEPPNDLRHPAGTFSRRGVRTEGGADRGFRKATRSGNLPSAETVGKACFRKLHRVRSRQTRTPDRGADGDVRKSVETVRGIALRCGRAVARCGVGADPHPRRARPPAGGPLDPGLRAGAGHVVEGPSLAAHRHARGSNALGFGAHLRRPARREAPGRARVRHLGPGSGPRQRRPRPPAERRGRRQLLRQRHHAPQRHDADLRRGRLRFGPHLEGERIVRSGPTRGERGRRAARLSPLVRHADHPDRRPRPVRGRRQALRAGRLRRRRQPEAGRDLDDAGGLRAGVGLAPAARRDEPRRVRARSQSVVVSAHVGGPARRRVRHLLRPDVAPRSDGQRRDRRLPLQVGGQSERPSEYRPDLDGGDVRCRPHPPGRRQRLRQRLSHPVERPRDDLRPERHAARRHRRRVDEPSAAMGQRDGAARRAGPRHRRLALRRQQRQRRGLRGRTLESRDPCLEGRGAGRHLSRLPLHRDPPAQRHGTVGGRRGEGAGRQPERGTLLPALPVHPGERRGGAGAAAEARDHQGGAPRCNSPPTRRSPAWR
jgi:hypothetical protein